MEGQSGKDAAPEAIAISHLWPGQPAGGAVKKSLSAHLTP